MNNSSYHRTEETIWKQQQLQYGAAAVHENILPKLFIVQSANSSTDLFSSIICYFGHSTVSQFSKNMYKKEVSIDAK